MDIFTCPDCGKQPKMLFDASFLMERPFEGIYLEIIPDGKGYKLHIKKEDEDYLEDFNMDKHLREARKMIDDDQGMAIYCPKCMEPLA